MENERIELISFDSLRIGYASGRHTKILLPPLSASASQGEFIAVIGRNGVGKSTLLRTIIGLQPLLEGIIKINGNDLHSIPGIDLARIAGYISTETIRVSNMKVYDLVALGRFPHTNWIGTIDNHSHHAIMDALEKTGMVEFSGNYVTELSDGERQRAMIARLLAQDTQLMIMDEPTAFLDIPGKFEIMNLIKSLTPEGKTVIFSTHDLSIAINMADRIWLVLKDGIIEGTPRELLKNGSFNNLFESSLTGTGNIAGVKCSPDYLKYFL